MCGLAGVYVRGGDADAARLEGLARVLRHRGPDDHGSHVDGPVGLLQTRLSIIGIATGHQPLRSTDGRFTLIANAEIYNHVELRRELEAAGHRFLTDSDCEVIVHGYREHGEGILERLHGMFAFALYDRDRRALLLARDRLGIKPLFVRADAGGVAFASELKALFALTGERPVIHADALAGYLQSNYSTGRPTIARGVERVLPAEALWIGAGGVERRWRYWRVEDVTPRRCGFDEAAEEFDALMATVVREHLRSDVPVGLFLSGGADSGLLLALMSRHGEPPVRTWSVGFSDAGVHDELEDAARTAARFDAVHAPLRLERDALLGRLPLAVWAADDLVGDYANLPTLALAEAAARELKVVFSGEGGDEVFAGYGRYRARGPRHWIDRARSPATAGYRARASVGGAWVDRVAGLALRAAAARWRAPFEDAWRACPPTWSALARRQAVDMATWLPDDLLVKADRMLMAWSLEGRVPYLDHRVVAFGLALPDRLKVDGATGKVFLKRYAERHLPRADLWRRKRGFTVPVRTWMSGAWLDRLERALAGHPVILEWFEPGAVRTLCARQRRVGRDAPALWALLQLAIWHSLFVTGGGERPAADADPLALIGGG